MSSRAKSDENGRVSFDTFQAVDIRVGEIVAVEEFPEARKPAYKLRVDFGEPLGVKKTSAQITAKYRPDTLLGRQVLAVTNFEPKQIGNFMSEVLVLGVPDDRGDIVLVAPEAPAAKGGRLH